MYFFLQQPIEHMYNPQAPPYGRYPDPNMPPMDMYGRYHPGGKKTKFNPNEISKQMFAYCTQVKLLVQ